MDDQAALQQALRQGLMDRGGADRAAAQRAYMKSAMPFAGVPMPEVRRLARQVGRDHPFGDHTVFESGIRRLWDDAQVREERYATLEILRLRSYARWRDPTLLPLYRYLVVTGAWWDLVDDVAVHLVGPLLRTHPADVAPALRGWADDADLWVRRSAVLAQVGSKDALDVDLLADVLAPNLTRPELFLRKAVGWALRDASTRHPAWVRAYVEAHRDELSPLSVKEATRRLAGP